MSKAAIGASVRVLTHSTRPVVAPEKASTLLKVEAPRIIMNIITVTRVAPSNDFTITPAVRQRKQAARIITPAMPQAADSVGVAHPSMIMPTTKKTMKLIGNTSLTTSRAFCPDDISDTS